MIVWCPRRGGIMPVSAANRHDDLRRQLEALHLDAFAHSFADLALRAAKEGISHEAYRYELVKLQRERREQRRVQRLLREAGLPPEKTFRTLSLDGFPAALRLQLERLKSGAFLKGSTNIVAIGKPGVGKSHALCAVAYELAEAGHPVLWTATSHRLRNEWHLISEVACDCPVLPFSFQKDEVLLISCLIQAGALSGPDRLLLLNQHLVARPVGCKSSRSGGHR